MEKYITIGKILGTHGNRGALRVLPLTDFPERFEQLTRARVSLRNSLRELIVEDKYAHKKYIIIKFKEIQTMNAAQELTGGYLVVTREELTPLPEGSYYIFDLIGADVFGIDGRRLGNLTEIIKTGSNDVYVVDTEAKPLLIPALKKVVKEINLAERRLVVQLPEGLTD